MDRIDINFQDKDNWTLLLYIIANKTKKVVKLLFIMNRIDTNLQTNDGQTPLCRAAAIGEKEVVKLLLAVDGMDINHQDKDGQTPLSHATKKGHKETVWLLASKLANASSHPDQTALSWAAEKGYEPVVRLLLFSTHEVKPDHQDSDAQSPFFKAAKNGHWAVAKLLALADCTTLHFLVREGQTALVKGLLSVDYDVCMKDNLSRTALHIAATYGHLEIAENLISSGAEVNAEDVNGTTPLNNAIRHGKQEIIGLLLKNSARVKGITADQWLFSYKKDAAKVVVSLSEGAGGKKSLRFIDIVSDHFPRGQADPQEEKCLL